MFIIIGYLILFFYSIFVLIDSFHTYTMKHTSEKKKKFALFKMFYGSIQFLITIFILFGTLLYKHNILKTDYLDVIKNNDILNPIFIILRPPIPHSFKNN